MEPCCTPSCTASLAWALVLPHGQALCARDIMVHQAGTPRIHQDPLLPP
jgi:hypothetical protein